MLYSRLLTLEDKNTNAYFGKLLSKLKVRNLNELIDLSPKLKEEPLFIAAVKCADEKTKNTLMSLRNKIYSNLEERQKKSIEGEENTQKNIELSDDAIADKEIINVIWRKSIMINTEPMDASQTKLSIVDFSKTHLCSGCNPVSCTVNGVAVQASTWRDLLVALTEMFIDGNSPKVHDLFVKPLLSGSPRPFLLKEKPSGAAKQLKNGYWIYVNLNIPNIVDIIGKLCSHCGVNLSNITITFVKKGLIDNGATNQETTIMNDDTTMTNIPTKLLKILELDYINGLVFDATTLRLLENKFGNKIDEDLQSHLKQAMFCRNDNIYFLSDKIIDKDSCEKLKLLLRGYIESFGCFELMHIYDSFTEKFNDVIIRNLADFESWISFNEIVPQTRCVSYMGTRIVRKNPGNIQELMSNLVDFIYLTAREELGGVISEDDLAERFSAFSATLLSSIIKDFTEELVKTAINGVICYQTLDVLGLTDEFSVTLAEVLDRVDELGLVSSEDVLHTALSLKMGVNFKMEYNIPDNRTYRRLIAYYYKGAPKREWQGGIFTEVPI